MRDFYSGIGYLSALEPMGRKESATGVSVDRSGFEGLAVEAGLGRPGVALSEKTAIRFILEHAKEDEAEAFTPVTYEYDVTEGSVDEDGVFATFSEEWDEPYLAGIGYVGGERYVRVKVEYIGDHTAKTVSYATIIVGHPRSAPVRLGRRSLSR